MHPIIVKKDAQIGIQSIAKADVEEVCASVNNECCIPQYPCRINEVLSSIIIQMPIRPNVVELNFDLAAKRPKTMNGIALKPAENR